MTLKAIIDEARKLTPAERAELMDELIVMIGPADLALTPAQQVDLTRRIEESRDGKAEVVPGDVAFEQLRKRS